MAHNHRYNFPQRYDALSDEHRTIIDSLIPLFVKYTGVQQGIQRDCLHFRFPNGMWCYINVKKQKYPILGVSRGAWMVRQEPILSALFDEVKKVVGKIVLKNADTIQNKGIPALIKKIYMLPKGIPAQ